MTAREALRAAESELLVAGVSSPGVDACILLAHVLDDTLSHLPTRLSEELDDDVAAKFGAVTVRRVAREPLAYITGETEFMGLRFKCDPRAFIPRPDTETLVEAVVELCGGPDAVCRAGTCAPPEVAEKTSPKHRTATAGHRSAVASDRWPYTTATAAGHRSPPYIAEIGTGTGCVAVSLARFLPEATVVATDASAEALELARENAVLNGVADRVRFVLGKDLEPLREAGVTQELTVLVSNPPYIPAEEIGGLEPEVSAGEPRLALDGGADGLEFYRRVLPQLAAFPALRLVAFEFGFAQEDAVAELIARHLPGWNVAIHKDLSDFPRAITARRLP